MRGRRRRRTRTVRRRPAACRRPGDGNARQAHDRSRASDAAGPSAGRASSLAVQMPTVAVDGDRFDAPIGPRRTELVRGSAPRRAVAPVSSDTARSPGVDSSTRAGSGRDRLLPAAAALHDPRHERFGAGGDVLVVVPGREGHDPQVGDLAGHADLRERHAEEHEPIAVVHDRGVAVVADHVIPLSPVSRTALPSASGAVSGSMSMPRNVTRYGAGASSAAAPGRPMQMRHSTRGPPRTTSSGGRNDVGRDSCPDSTTRAVGRAADASLAGWQFGLERRLPDGRVGGALIPREDRPAGAIARRAAGAIAGIGSRVCGVAGSADVGAAAGAAAGDGSGWDAGAISAGGAAGAPNADTGAEAGGETPPEKRLPLAAP